MIQCGMPRGVLRACAEGLAAWFLTCGLW